MIAYGLRRALRTRRRLIAYFCVLIIVCAFLCVGLNLKQTADENIAAILNDFNLIALPNFKAHIDEKGKLAASPHDSIGFFSCKAENYDLQTLQELPGVVRVDARNQFGACVNGQKGLLYQTRCSRQTALRYAGGMDVVIFQLNSSTPLAIEGFQKQQGNDKRWVAKQVDIPIRLIWAASGRTELTRLSVCNPTFDYIYELEPGKTYIINMGEGGYLTSDIYHQAYSVQVSAQGVYRMNEAVETEKKANYPAITEYYEGFWDMELGRYFQQSAEACYLAGNSLTAITTSDISMIPSWASGDVHLQKGELFSEEDYENGNKVCIISQKLLEVMGWEIGDTIDFSFYETNYILNQYIRNQYSTFDPSLYADAGAIASGKDKTMPMEQVFDENTYTIIGTFDGKVCWKDDHESYLFNESMHWLMVLLPSTSVQNQPEVKLSQYMTSIQVEPMMLQKFLVAAQSSGLMEEQTYGYQLGLTVDDHGLSGMISGLEALQEISRLVLLLSSLTAGLAVLVLVILHLLQNRRQIAILRSMGIKKAQVAAFVTTGILLASLLGTVIGGLAGQRLSNDVAERILTTAQEDSVDDRFSAMTSVKTAEDETFELEVAADPDCTRIAVGSIFGAMLLLSVGAVLWEGHKPPLLMLGVKE